MIAAVDLDALLTRLRAAGLRVGVEESLRAAYLVAQLQDTSAAQWLREVLRALLVKSCDQTEPFDEVFSAWALELADRERPTENIEPQTELAPAPTGTSAIRPPAKQSLRSWLRRHWIYIAALLILLCVIGGVGRWLLRPRPLEDSPVDSGMKPPPEDPGLALPPPRRTLHVVAPSIAVEPPPSPELVWKGSAALLSGLFLGGLLYFTLRRRRYLPLAAALPTRLGPREIVLSEPKPATGLRLRLLDLRSQEALVWGIGRFLSEQKTHRLDVPASVEATAATAGIPSLRFLHARHQREVWLWLDESAACGDTHYGPLLRQLEHELVISLRQGGLPVEEALYWGVPDRLSRLLESGQVEGEFAPSEVEERRDAALVVLLTDGKLLADALKNERYREETKALLRQLAHFPQLAFCDVSRDQFGLAALLAPLELSVLAPEQVAKFLGGVPLDPPLVLPEQLSGDLRLWAAACALFPYPLEEETLFWVRDQLGLQVPAAASVALKGLAQPCGDRLLFAGSSQSPMLLGWLRQISPCDDVPHFRLREHLGRTWLGRCLALWRERLADEANRREADEVSVPWRSTPAEQHLRMQRALLDLWDQPQSAALVLHSLGAGWLRDELSKHLSALGPLEVSGHSDLTILPWHEQRLPLLTQGILRELGFGGNRPRPEVKAQRPGRLVLAWLGCIGVVLAGVLTLAQGLWQLSHTHGEPIVHQEHEPKDARITLEQLPDSKYLLTASTKQGATTVIVLAGSKVLVTWEAEERDPPDGGAEQPQDLGADLTSSPELEELGDSAPLPDLQSPVPPWNCPYAEYKESKSGIVFVKVCAGDFKMGSAANDKEADDDEKPAYLVHVDTFWIGKYEVSNAQYRKMSVEHRSPDDGEEEPVQRKLDGRASVLSVDWG